MACTNFLVHIVVEKEGLGRGHVKEWEGVVKLRWSSRLIHTHTF